MQRRAFHLKSQSAHTTSDSWNMRRHVRLGLYARWVAGATLHAGLRCHNLWCYQAGAGTTIVRRYGDLGITHDIDTANFCPGDTSATGNVTYLFTDLHARIYSHNFYWQFRDTFPTFVACYADALTGYRIGVCVCVCLSHTAILSRAFLSAPGRALVSLSAKLFHKFEGVTPIEGVKWKGWGKIGHLQPLSNRISETVQDRAKVYIHLYSSNDSFPLVINYYWSPMESRIRPFD